jgi:4-hydroxybenzoate polyprenyltransferase
MASLNECERMEYTALMNRGRDAERTSQLCWIASGIGAAVLLSWAIAARSPGLMLPVIFAAAFGFYAMLHGRQQVRLIAGYVKEFVEGRENGGPQWFTRLGHLEVVPGFNPSADWLSVCLANAVIAASVVLAWVYAGAEPRGDLMAGIVTGVGIAFGFHSVSETSRLHQTNAAAFWRQVSGGTHDERPNVRVVGR